MSSNAHPADSAVGISEAVAALRAEAIDRDESAALAALPSLLSTISSSAPSSPALLEALNALRRLARSSENTQKAVVAGGAFAALASVLRRSSTGARAREASECEAVAVSAIAALSDPERYLAELVDAGLVPLLLHLALELVPCRTRKLAVQALGDVSESIWTRGSIAAVVRSDAVLTLEALDAALLAEGAAVDAAERECWRELTRNCELRRDLYHAGKPFYDAHSGEFPFVKMLEDNWAVIRAEALQLREELMVAWPEKYLYTTGWDVLAMFAFENKIEGPAASCPKTVALLEQIPGLQTAVFSRLQPRAHIKPHVGYYAYSERILRVHLGVIVPEGCTLMVNGEQRQWREGEVMVFDDTFRHEAWNPSADKERIVLMFDINYTFKEDTRNPDFVETTRRQKEALGDVPALVSKDLIAALDKLGTTPKNFTQRPDVYH